MDRPAHLSPQQEKWFASLRANLEAETGRSVEEWVALARTCPETAPRKRLAWLKTEHGMGVNRASFVLALAFPDGPGWDEPDAMVDHLWPDASGRAIYDAVAACVLKAVPDTIIGPRKTFVSFSRRVQFAAILPVRGGKAELGLPLALDASPRLLPMKRRPWAERHTALLLLTSPPDVDDEVARLIVLAAAGA